VNFLLSYRAMFYAPGYDEQFARPEPDTAITHLNGQIAFEHKEEIVGVIVLVPNELTLRFDDHDVVSIELGDGSRLPVLGERRQLGFEIDLMHLLNPFHENRRL